jgi:hypothetical protein
MVRGGVDLLEFDGVPVPLTYTPANLGGWRPWMLCAECDTMRGRLFLDAGKWVCRICADVRYASENYSLRSQKPAMQIARIDQQVTWARRPWQARVLLAKRARLVEKLKAMK